MNTRSSFDSALNIMKRILMGMVIFYIAHVIICEIIIMVPHLKVEDEGRLYIYRSGSTDYDGFLPPFGMIFLLGGSPVHLVTYENTVNKGWVLVADENRDIFEDFPLYTKHIKMALHLKPSNQEP